MAVMNTPATADLDLADNYRTKGALPSGAANHYVTRGELEGMISSTLGAVALLVSGANNMTGALDFGGNRGRRLGAPTQPDDAARLMDTGFQVGVIVMFGAVMPSRPGEEWRLCNGDDLVRIDYPDLFAIYGTTFGSAAPSTFKLPDLRGRFPLGSGNGSGLTNRVLAATGGEEKHLLTTDELPTDASQNLLHQGGGGGISDSGGAGALGNGYWNKVIGGNQSHENMPPFLVMNFYIRAK